MNGQIANKHVLVVEDEYFIASDLKRLLTEEGAVVLGPTGDLKKGLSMAEASQLDAAILDVNLEGVGSYPIADRLIARGIPFLLLTGYDAWSLPAAYRDAPRLAKPFSPGLVKRSVRDLIERTNAG